ncbi:TonB-dependent receptor [Sphingomonas aliaeris]|uniref:TonB-dependent receptor n=1 Tax=Sphingomonas aliaeris TaxID=2759526 RepID=A0A974NVA5_9SPHN|nr:TonB-dependent receptor [Sphingomonas aliaeris]QQV77631.1 TonB-dependent receptor [Sphingomonas aliaeris]
MRSIQASAAVRLRSTAAPVALLIALSATPAFSQTIEPLPTSPVATEPADEGDDIVVTGSLFRGTDTKTALPVTVITSESLARAGITNTADAIRQAAADGAGSIGIGFTSGFSAGGSAISLRNLGVSSTLVLVNGLRVTNYPLSDDGHNSYVDLNSIPQINVERIEVLKDGASSLYGADAIGGVVNIITRKQFQGLEGGAEAGATEKGDGHKYRLRLLGGIGDYASQGWNFYVGGEYEDSGKITADSRGFPFNTLDLRAAGGVDNNRADDTLTSATTNAVVTRVTQSDLNNPLAGNVANASSPAIFNSLTPLANCAFGTYSENTASRVGTACKHDLTREYVQILPKQRRYAGAARLSFRVSDNIEGYVDGSYSNNKVDITLLPRAVRQNQAFGGAPSTSTTNPGIVLPVYICSAGINCATAADRRLNPNNPYAAAFASNPSEGAARLYYLFGDVKAGSERTNELYRITGGLHGTIADTWRWKVDLGYSRDNLELTQTGFANLNGLVKAINTGSYNFVDPSLNSQAVRDSVLPPVTSLSNSSEFTVDGTISRSLFALPGGDVQVAVGGQYRKEKLANRSANPNLDIPGLSTAQAFGDRDVWAGYFEIAAPIIDQLTVNVSGRYDDYSEGFSKFSPKISAKFTPIEQISFRGSYSEGFRTPTFAEIDPRSSFSGFVGYTPDAAFKAAHPTNAGYTANYSVGRGFVGNPNIQPETSRSFTVGAIVQPTRWFTFTADYFNVRKSGLITAGSLAGKAITEYYSVANQSFASAAAASAAGCAKVAAVGAGYSCNVIDGADPFALNALPRLLVLNAPYVNVNYDVTTGLQFTATAQVPVSEAIQFESRLDLQATLKFDRHLEDGTVQRFVGSVGPADLSSGGGTPKWRGNWQNTLSFGQFSLSATTYFVGRMKAVATDQGNLDTSCAASVYKDANGGNSFCKIDSFIYADLNATVRVNDKFSFFGFVGNFTNAGAPFYPNTFYTTQPNYLASWHLPGLIGRTFRAGANFKF